MKIINKISKNWYNKLKSIVINEEDIKIEKLTQILKNMKLNENNEIPNDIKEEIKNIAKSINSTNLTKSQVAKLRTLDAIYTLNSKEKIGNLLKLSTSEENNINIIEKNSSNKEKNINNSDEIKQFYKRLQSAKQFSNEQIRVKVSVSVALKQLDNLLTQIGCSRKDFFEQGHLKEDVRIRFEQLFNDIDTQFDKLNPEQYIQRKNYKIEYNVLDSVPNIKNEDIRNYIEVLSKQRSEKVELYKWKIKNAEVR